MKKKYDITKKSDMRRFARDLEQEILNRAEEAINDQMGNACPNCGSHLRLHFGTNVCPECGAVVEFTVK